MKVAIGSFIVLMLSVGVGAEPLIEGRVRLDSGESVADAQVRIFDLADLRRGAIARAMTDGTGYFALPIAALRGRALPTSFTLGPNYPNPFNPATIIPYQLAASSQVRLEVFNLLGQRITTLVDGARPAGFHTAAWNATDAAGRAMGAGVYIYRMTVGAASQTGRMVLIDGQAGVSSAGAASDFDWLGAEGGGPAEGPVYGLIVSGEGLAPYVDSAFRVEAGMALVEVVVSAGAGKAADDDCAFCDLFDALNDDDEGPSPSGKALAGLAAPPAPTNLRVEAVGDRFGRVRWDAAEGATDYDVNYKPASGGRWTNQPHRGVGLYNTIHDLEPGTEYRWAVRAENSDGPSEWVFGPNFTTVGADGQVHIPDANLRAAIEAALGKASGAPITKGDMTRLFRLEAYDADISDLTGLEFAANLTELELGRNAVSDVSPLAGLTNLTFLGLSWNYSLSDLSPLAGLTNLTFLGLSWNYSLSDLSPLAGLINLSQLSLPWNSLSDLSPLTGLTNLYYLDLADNLISDLSPLAGLTNLRWLKLEGNLISDISVLRGLTNLGELNIRDQPLSVSSINDHIPALQDLGVTVEFDPLLRDSDFDIELVFLDDHFDEQEKRKIRYAARRWMSIIREDLPDHTFAESWSSSCGSRSYSIPSGERIDDLRIYVAVEVVEWRTRSFGSGWSLGEKRERDHLPVAGCVEFDSNYRAKVSLALHEIGHVLGIGSGAAWWGFLQTSSDDPHFNGPRAIAAFDDAGGQNYTGAKVPVTKDGTHWALPSEIMNVTIEGALSAITIQALADLGYVVDVTQAHPYTLFTYSSLTEHYAPAAKVAALPGDRLTRRQAPQPPLSCGVGQHQEPIYVVDPQGRIVRTISP